MRQQHILIVEDELETLHILEHILKANNYKVTTAVNGNIAFEIILKKERLGEQIDLLITDIQMPDFSGEELLDCISLIGTTFPIIVITGYGDEELQLELKFKGCNKYIEKPFSKEELLNSVQSFLKEKYKGKVNKV